MSVVHQIQRDSVVPESCQDPRDRLKQTCNSDSHLTRIPDHCSASCGGELHSRWHSVSSNMAPPSPVVVSTELPAEAIRPKEVKMAFNVEPEAWTNNFELLKFVRKSIQLCKPDAIYFCDGSREEYDSLCGQLVAKGVFRPLAKRPGSYWTHSDSSDVARVEDRTFICSQDKQDAGPTNRWRDPAEMKVKLTKRFDGCMRGRTMYVVPYCMGPVGGPISQLGVEITDSAYVVVSMYVMTRMGDEVLKHINQGAFFCPCLHSVGAPLMQGQKDVVWPCNRKKYIVHFPEERQVWSYGSGYGGNALLNKKCFALRIASVMGRDQGWLAEHMLIVGLTNPQGVKKYFCAAFPSGCGKTNLAMLQPTLPGWTVECVGDDIAWLKFGEDGQLYAINPENGFFGIAPGTNMKTNPNAMECCAHDTVFTNTAVTEDGDVWWEGMTKEKPAGLRNWLDQPYSGDGVAAHANSRFCSPLRNCPIASSEIDSPQGVPISGIIFGGRRPSLVPLVYESFSWAHGTLIGAMTSSETTAAMVGEQGRLRHDPFAMLPFCGYNMGDYFAHWLRFGAQAPRNAKLPKMFGVNWFRQGAKNDFLWPGFGDNARVMKWMFERIEGTAVAEQTPIGFVPRLDDTGVKGGVDVSGMGIDDETANALMKIDTKAWLDEADETDRYFAQFGDRLPEGLKQEVVSLRQRLGQH
eukprot:TRINITY_DN2645_c0_g1_i1.p1 TRINITY_DN2645_c0_g1~~TRINITY_DN2645_c0_g1_i1.p1  ORF type:complete len:691 (+),score=117.81 TRINITY_DN2645_c0_g1_i1:526-2598(+)